jgi:Na+/proline symporter
VIWQGPGIAVVSLYLIVLLLLGWQGYRRRREDSLSDFYLAGSSLGFIVLLATLYASQYSGNTFLGYTGEAYRIGFAWMMSVGMMMSVIIVYLLFAPSLHLLSSRYGYVTPSDWVRHRFQDRRLAFLVALIMAVSLLNYLYAQFLAMGHMAYRMSDGQVPFWVGVVGLAGVIGLYETLGGMRSVAWTDVVQGLMLFLGLLLVLAIAWPAAVSLEHISRGLLERRPELVQVPTWEMCGKWASSIVLLGVGASLYPHAIQRIYAARDAMALRRSFRVMVCMPLFTTLVVLLIGILAHGLLPRDSVLSTDEVMPALLSALFQTGTLAQWATVTVLTAGLAAIMSTADSALLSLSSILARDFVGEWRGHRRDEASLARTGKRVSWAIIVLLVIMAVRPPTTLWRLIEIKMQLLIQVAPMFIIGIRSTRLDARTALLAVSVGSAIYLFAIALSAWGIEAESIGGVHIGTIGCAVNAGICWWGVRKKR